MKIGIMSDIHDNIGNLIQAIDVFQNENCELLLFCGDWGSPNVPNFLPNSSIKTISVFGNNDADIFTFLTRKDEKGWNVEFHKYCAEIELDGKKIVVYHGDSEPILDSLLKCGKYDIVCSGHNHQAKIDKTEKTTHINPGSVTNIRFQDINHEASIAIYDTNTNEAKIIKIN